MSDTKTILDLFDYEFNIPYYQRGYKWEEQEVNELLNDLWDFYNNSDAGQFYCLQPIVVKTIAENKFDVIDGQQRLTTIYLILSYLKDKIEEDNYRSDFFNLTYETRKESQSFIDDCTFADGVNDENIDFFYMSTAYKTIDIWFKANPGSKGKLTSLLLDTEDLNNKNVKFIWYDLGGENPVDAFIRLNVGKIPLTDAELIKALLLQLDKYPDAMKATVNKDLEKIANEWDKIEYRLQEEEFWYFLNDAKNNYPTHIEFIFNLLAEKHFGNKIINAVFENKKPTKYRIYLILAEYLKTLRYNKHNEENKGDEEKDLKPVKIKKPTVEDDLKSIELFWKEVVNYYENFNEWFNDRKLFHYIGFILSVDKTPNIIDVLIKESTGVDKDVFEESLINRIKNIIKTEATIKNEINEDVPIKLEELNYDDHPYELRKVLLLHNVITTLNSYKENAKFPFNLYKKTEKTEKWSLEHIHAQNSENITDKEKQKIWLLDHVELLKNKDELVELKEKIECFLSGELQDVTFEILYEEVFNILSGHTKNLEKHTLQNICLLDGRTNSSLNNSVFEVKRAKVREREVSGHFIPIASRNVFLKTYSKYPKNSTFWDTQDRLDYIENIKTVLHQFLSIRWQQIKSN